MLVLTRKQGETITLDGGITIKITRCRSKDVQVGITAPAETRILRGELEERNTERRTA